MTRSMQRLALAATLVFRALAFAQEFELDLSEEKPAKPPPELRPSIAVLSVLPADTEEATIGRARQLESEILKQLVQSDDFQTVVEPSVVKKTYGAKSGEVEQCTTYACFDGAAKTLKVNRALRVTVQKQGAGSLVTFIGFDPGFSEVLTVTQESGEKAEKSFLGVSGKSQAQKDKEFMKKISPFIKQGLAKLATPNGKISIDNVDASALVTIDNAEAGTGTFEAVVQRGSHTVKVTAAGYKPFEQSVSVEPLKTATVKVSLVARPVEVQPLVVKPESTGTPIYARPGLYVAAAGAVAVGVGLVFGQMASGVQSKINAGGDPVGVTRAQAKAAPTQALLANILVGAGAAAIAGGTTWIILTPSGGAAPPKPSTEPTESTTTTTSLGFMLGVGGTF